MAHELDSAGTHRTRREALLRLGAVALALVGGVQARAQSGATCIVRPQQTEGPFFVDTGLDRSDIRTDPATGAVSAGVPLALAFRVSRLAGSDCRPLAGAHVELWHCDAAGVYSGFGAGGPDAAGRKFLRGFQVTDGGGTARFTTVYPGWYPGRTVHLHFLIRAGRAAARREEFASQLYFDDALTDRVHAGAPYAARGPRSTRNAADGLYRRGGPRLLLAPVQTMEGLEASFDIALAAA